MRFVETPVFTKRVKDLFPPGGLTPDQLRVLVRIVREELK